MSRQRRLRWTILGAGTAGRARARGIERDERGDLVSVWRGRFAGELGVPAATSLEAAIEAATAVAICSPSEAHAEQVRAVLEAGRHALVELPLALDAAEAAELFALARRRGRVLHVEHIELLDAPSQTLRALVRPTVIEKIEVKFERQGPGSADPASLALGNLARLHRVASVGGAFSHVHAVRASSGRLEASLTLATGAEITATFQQAPYFARRTVLRIDAPGSCWEQINGNLTRDGNPQTLLGVGPLFNRDQAVASGRILDGAPAYVDEERILHVLDVATMLARGETGPVPHRSAARGRESP